MYIYAYPVCFIFFSTKNFHRATRKTCDYGPNILLENITTRLTRMAQHCWERGVFFLVRRLIGMCTAETHDYTRDRSHSCVGLVLVTLKSDVSLANWAKRWDQSRAHCIRSANVIQSVFVCKRSTHHSFLSKKTLACIVRRQRIDGSKRQSKSNTSIVRKLWSLISFECKEYWTKRSFMLHNTTQR
jgi:hypothetical protein